MNDNLKKLTCKYKQIGFNLDFSSILKYEENKEYYSYLLDSLETIYSIVKQVQQKKLDYGIEFRFKITTNYDKRFYCATKIADSAKKLYFEPANSSYYVVYTGDQIDEIEMSYNVLCNILNYTRKDMELARQYLMEYSPTFRFYAEILKINMPKLDGSTKQVYEQPFLPVINQLEWQEKEIKNELYSCMVAENRIQSKWVSEYRLFIFVKSLCPEAVYQYHCEWLGQQSYDIFLPNQQIAIEYQGEQHYKDTRFFSSYEEYKERDKRKLDISNANGIRVLYFSYETYVVFKTVKQFLEDNKVITIELDDGEQIIQTECPGLYIAPIVDKTIPRVKKAVSISKQKIEKHLSPDRIVIRQYEINGKFIAQYETYGEASDKTGVAKRPIQRCVSGEKKSGGGFLWKKVPASAALYDSSPVLYCADPQKKAVCQYTVNGIKIAEYASISEAARETGINISGIRKVLQGLQKQAGESIWRYKASDNDIKNEDINRLTTRESGEQIKRDTSKYNDITIQVQEDKSEVNQSTDVPLSAEPIFDDFQKAEQQTMESRNKERKKLICAEISDLNCEMNSIRGFFAVFRRKKLQKRIIELNEQLRHL